MSITRWLILASTTLVLVLSNTHPAQAGLSAHERDLLLAQLEDLHSRLSTGEEPLKVKASGARPTGTDEPPEMRSQARARMHSRHIHIVGQSDGVLGWLSLVSQRRMAPRPPLVMRALPGPGRRIELTTSVWWLSDAPFDPAAPAAELVNLRDNLLWLERHVTSALALTRLLDPLVDTEGVRLNEATWNEGVLTIKAQALDDASAVAFEKIIAQRTDKMDKPPRIDLQLSRSGPGEDKLPAQGVHMADLDPADAVLLGASISRGEVVLAGQNLPRLNGHLKVAQTADLLPAIIARLPLKSAKFGAVHILARELSPEPPPAGQVPESPLAVILHRTSPSEAFTLVGEVSRMGTIVSSAVSDRVTAALKKRTARQVSQMISWALGLTSYGNDRLLALLPPGAKKPAPAAGADGRKAQESVSLRALDAPLTQVIAELSGLQTIRDCRSEAPMVNLRVGASPADELQWALLAGNQARLHKLNQREGLLTPDQLQKPPSASSCSAPISTGPDSPPRLAAVLAGKSDYRALLFWKKTYRWVAEGEQLGPDQRVLKIRGNRISLSSSGKEPIYLTLSSKDNTPAEPSGPTRQGLANLRLAATALVPGSKPVALVEDRRGNSHLVGQGDGIGWRCGRIKAVVPGRLLITLGCPRAHEPAHVEMYLSKIKPTP